MKELFVNYKLASLAYKKGFDKKCLGSYYVFGDNKARNGRYGQTRPKLFIGGYRDGISVSDMSAVLELHPYHDIGVPMYQQLVDWLRTKHKLHIEISLGHDESKIWYNAYLYKVEKGYDYNPIGEERINANGESYYKTLSNAIEVALKMIK